MEEVLRVAISHVLLLILVINFSWCCALWISLNNVSNYDINSSSSGRSSFRGYPYKYVMSQSTCCLHMQQIYQQIRTPGEDEHKLLI
jgi:hypothetical protein